MNCLCSGEIVKEQEDTMVPSSSELLATKDFFSATASGFSGQDEQVGRRLDSGNIEQAELSLRESGILNYEVGFFFSLIIYYLI
jgi:predicted regulator of Ras-like GTPase activity (Roadblock/LC7/MglB family)